MISYWNIKNIAEKQMRYPEAIAVHIVFGLALWKGLFKGQTAFHQTVNITLETNLKYT